MNDSLIILDIEHFGPIEKVRIVFDKYTVLIGRQGSGKSTIAKLYSMFTWMEKALARHIITDKYVMSYSRFQKKYCAYHRMESYFKEDTYIGFQGLHYNFIFKDGQFLVETKDPQEDYHVAKVMYVPAERNFLSTVDNTSKLKELPQSLQTFLEEFENAKEALKTGYNFPFSEVQFEYDSFNKVSWVKGVDYKIRLSAASSGYQSVLPLVLVSKYLSKVVQDNTLKKELDQQEIKQINKEIDKIMNDGSLTEDVKFAMARSVSSRFKYSHFINIVEELEQNLYPESQMATLYELLGYANAIPMNRVLLTTHSPYIINYFSLGTKAWQLNERLTEGDGLREKLFEVVPEQSLINPDFLRIYELKDRKAYFLDNVDGIPSDDNFLNNQLEMTNEWFGQLLEIEEEIDNGKQK